MISALIAALVFACSSSGGEEDDVLLSGRVRVDPESDAPVPRAYVRVTDANKSQRCFVTACDGTFVVRRGDVPFLSMPLVASVERVDRPEAKASAQTTLVRLQMRGRVSGVRDCNGCHLRGVALFSSAAAGADALRGASTACTDGRESEIVCPEDRLSE